MQVKCVESHHSYFRSTLHKLQTCCSKMNYVLSLTGGAQVRCSYTIGLTNSGYAHHSYRLVQVMGLCASDTRQPPVWYKYNPTLMH